MRLPSTRVQWPREVRGNHPPTLYEMFFECSWSIQSFIVLMRTRAQFSALEACGETARDSAAESPRRNSGGPIARGVINGRPVAVLVGGEHALADLAIVYEPLALDL